MTLYLYVGRIQSFEQYLNSFTGLLENGWLAAVKGMRGRLILSQVVHQGELHPNDTLQTRYPNGDPHP